MSDSSEITIVVLIALPEEYEQFKTIFPITEDLSTPLNVCLEHRLEIVGYRLISILAEQMGSQSAADSAALAVETFKPDLIVVLGIGGAISKDAALGDVCVSNEIIDTLQNNKIVDRARATDTSLAPDFYNVDAELVASFAFLRVHPGLEAVYSEWKADAEVVSDSPAELDPTRSPEMHIGPIACGPVVASKRFIKKVQDLHRKVLAIETESGGVFGHIARKRIPAISIRGISDFSDGEKAKLEADTNGLARQIAMRNASKLLKVQLNNNRFLDVAKSHAELRTSGAQPVLFSPTNGYQNVVSVLDDEIKNRLKELSSEFRARPDGFYLPVPRIRQVSYVDELAGKQLLNPENILSCLEVHDRILVKLPRSYPSQALGWSLAHSLLRQQLDGKVILPYVLCGRDISPPRNGFHHLLPKQMVDSLTKDEFQPVLILEEPIFNSRSRMNFLRNEIENISAKILVITKSEDSVSETDELMREKEFVEYELAPVSFSETAFFLEKTFAMTPSQAEAVAIRLDDTFRKFHLDAHPTYFAGLQEETVAALIHANRRAELIQLAVDGLLTLAVAADKERDRLSRTTRERFLRILALEMADKKAALPEDQLIVLATKFLADHKFEVQPGLFLKPFFDMGLLYRNCELVYFAHPYLESYILAQALREDTDRAIDYFNPKASEFNYYAYDLYCELGPNAGVVENITNHAAGVLAEIYRSYPEENIYLDAGVNLASLSAPTQIASLSQGLMATAEKMDSDRDNPGLREEKQRILDTRRYVRVQVGLQTSRRDDLPQNIRSEFSALDKLSRALSLTTTTIGAGSESLSGEAKQQLARLVLGIGDKFSDLWTRNRSRVDFSSVRNDILSDNNIWKMVGEMGLDDGKFDLVKADLEIFIHSLELNFILEPMGQVLWKISSLAGAKVLTPVIEDTIGETPIQKIIRSSWLSEISPEKGRDSFKNSLASYSGSPLLRLVLASHLLWRVFWHHYKTEGAKHLVNSAKRALRAIGLAPAAKHVEEIKKGSRSR